MNPINNALGLATELTYAQESGDKERETGVREQLAWVAGELDKVDPAPLHPETRELYDQAKAAVTDALATKPKRAAKAAPADA